MLLKLMEMVAWINKHNQLQRADNLADHDCSICASSLVLFCANGVAAHADILLTQARVSPRLQGPVAAFPAPSFNNPGN